MKNNGYTINIQCQAKQNVLQRMGLTVILVILRIALAFRYRLQIKGLQAVLDKAREAGRPCLFLPNHPALIDPVILYSIIGRRFRPRPLADEAQANRPGLKKIFQKIIRVIVIPDVAKKGRVARQGVNEALQNVVKALAAGENVMLYPSGHTYRQQNEQISGNSGLDQVLKGLREMGRPLPTLIVARTSNLWGSRFSRAWGVYPRLVKVFRQGLLALPFNLFFFMPRRRVTVEFGIFEEFNALAAQSDKRREVNAWLENYYNEISAPAAAVPLYFWQGSEPVPLEQLQTPALSTAHSDIKISGAVWEQVQAHLQEISGREEISREMRLAADLDMDSLSIAELSVWIENEFGHNIADLDTLVTVNDVLAATQGRLTGKVAEQKSIPANWLSHERKGADIRLGLPACPNLEGTVSPSLPSLFLAQARKAPRRQILLDYSSGVKTYRSLLVGIEALRSKFISLPGERVGIMLPCSAAVISTYYAALLASKTPVMVNWTLGVGNIKHCLNLSETEVIITARALTSRLVRQGFDIDAITTLDGRPVRWVYLEDVAAGLSRGEKIGALLRSIFSRKLDRLASRRKTPGNPDGISEVAAILFTSGSEALPKAVPLTHANLVSNLSDVATIFNVSSADRMLGMLPPFHSMGLTGNVALPMSYSLPLACHANPAESAPLVSLISNCRLTMIASPPSFLDGILMRAKGTDALKSMRLAFIGAEKCPEHVFKEYAEQCPHGVICEGYGVTECSPGVCINRPENIYPGSIGVAIPSVELRVVRNYDQAEPGGLVAAEPDQTGMLLVRGQNVFSGYLVPPAAMNIPAPKSPFVEFEGRQWYATGDLVSMNEEQVITFRGRLKRFIKLGGEMISLPQIENVLLEHFSRLEAAEAIEGPLLAVETKDEENPEIVLFSPLEISREEANSVLRKAGLSGLHSIRRVVQLPELPVLGTGKTDYRELKTILN